MDYFICNGSGDSLDNPTPLEMDQFLNELDPKNEEHGRAWLNVNEADDTLEYSLNGNLGYAREGHGNRHLNGVTIAKVVDLWVKLAEGRFDELEQEPWRPGLYEPLTPKQEAHRKAELDDWQLAPDREFYDILGPERPDVPCRAPGCNRGAIDHSLLCRAHHFQNIKGRPSPFD